MTYISYSLDDLYRLQKDANTVYVSPFIGSILNDNNLDWYEIGSRPTNAARM